MTALKAEEQPGLK